MTLINAEVLSNFVSLQCLSSLLNTLLQNTMAEQNVPTQPPTRTDSRYVPRSHWITNREKQPTIQAHVPCNLLQQKALAITPVIPAQPFELPPSGNIVIDFVNELGYPEPVEIVSNIRVNYVYQPWRAILTLINQCLTGKTSGSDKPRHPVLPNAWSKSSTDNTNVDQCRTIREVVYSRSEVKKTDHSANVLASIKSPVPMAVDKYLGTKLDDALLKSVKNQDLQKQSLRRLSEPKRNKVRKKQDQQPLLHILGTTNTISMISIACALRKNETRSDPESEHSEQSSDDIPMQDDGHNARDQASTPEPEWTIPPNDFPEPENNWANTYATTRTGKKKLCKADLEGPAFNLVKAFHKNSVFLQYQMDECHKLLTNKVDLSNPEGHQILRNIYEPLPLGGPPGQVTIQPQFFFNKDLDYLLTGDKERKIALSISKLKAARYLDFGLEELVPSLWVESEREYDISAVAVSSSLRLLEPKRTIESRAKRSSINLVRTQHPSETMVFHNEDGNPARANDILKMEMEMEIRSTSDIKWITECSDTTYTCYEVMKDLIKVSKLPQTLTSCISSQVHKMAIHYKMICRMYSGDELKANIETIEDHLIEGMNQTKGTARVGSGSHSEKIRTYNYKDNRVTDHRLKMNFELTSFLDGDIETAIQSCVSMEQRELLEELADSVGTASR
ncbi:hypothetical protein Tco_0120897 [Tanacetum coccineum]